RIFEIGIAWTTVKACPGDRIVNMAARETPLDAGLVTVTSAIPANARSRSLISAVICEAVTKRVARVLPFQEMTEVLLKFSPLTVSVKSPLMAVALSGKIAAIDGMGSQGEATAGEPAGVMLCSTTAGRPAECVAACGASPHAGT